MGPLDKLRACVGERIEEVVAAFVAAAQRSGPPGARKGVAPVDLARTDVWVVADTSSAIVRDSVRYVEPDPPRGPGSCIMFAADRVQLVNRPGVVADTPHGLKALEAPPPRGWLRLVCLSESDEGRLEEQHSFVELPDEARDGRTASALWRSS